MKVSKIVLSCALFFLYAANIFSQTRPVASTISAQTGLDRTIEIQWEFPQRTEPQITSVKIYRSSKPVSSYKEIEGQTPIANFFGMQFTDNVATAGDYFYTVIAVTPTGDYKTVIPGMNATIKGVRAMVPASRYGEQKDESVAFQQKNDSDESEKNSDERKSRLPEITKQKTPAIRNMPLPLPTNLLGEEPLEISKEAAESVNGLGSEKTKKASPFKTPYFFEDDMFAPDSGDEYILFETLRAGLVPRKYKKSVKLLSDFLSVNRNSVVTNRAEFYLGESFYFCGEYQNAIRCFLTVQEIFPELAKQWIDSSLDLLDIDF